MTFVSIYSKDIYIRYDNVLTLTENPDNPDELCYLGFEMGAFESFKIRDTDRANITDITLAKGTTGVSTNGTEIAFQVDGTFNFYITWVLPAAPCRSLPAG